MTARGEVLWSPPVDAWATTALGRFGRAQGIDDLAELIRWSTNDIDRFWAASTAFTGVRWSDPPDSMRDGTTMPGVRWFPGATLNYADQALAPGRSMPGAVAVIAESQSRDPVELTWAQLTDMVERCAAGLRRLGVDRGARVVAYAPNIPETVIAFLATASLGAVWSSCAPEFGVRSVVDRFSQIEPTVLIAIDGYRYGAKVVDRRDHLGQIVDALSTLRHVVGIPYLDASWRPMGDARDGPHAQLWDELLGPGGAPGAQPPPPAPQIAPVPADHPLYVLFSSGTTGLPKAIVHGHGGIVAEHLKVLTFHQDLCPGDRFFWFSTTGWMMWNYLLSGLLVGSTIVLFDGDPASPDLTALWDVARRTGASVFGASAPFLMASRKAGIAPERGDLRWVGSTGAPLPADGYRWVVATLGVPVSSICGGTDVCTAFIGSSPVQDVRAGEMGGRLLGCAVEAFDPDGRPCPVGETGELVIVEPMPSMPVGFWRDDDGSRYRAAYFEDFPGVWRHGDWVTFAEDGTCVVTGRSDATLNRGGVRLGTSDFYAVVEGFEEVTDSLVVHVEDAEGEGGMGKLILFVAVAAGAVLDDELRAALRRALARDLSPRHTPDIIEAVPVIPRTLSGKKLELPVKRILAGEPADRVASRDSLADPTSLDAFVDRARRRD